MKCLPPDVATFREAALANDLRSHPGIRAATRHQRSLVDLSCQTKICYLQCLVGKVTLTYGLLDENCGQRETGVTTGIDIRTCICLSYLLAYRSLRFCLQSDC